MGRKSSQKKIVRKIVEEKSEKEKSKLGLLKKITGQKKSKKEIKEEAVKESNKKVKHSTKKEVKKSKPEPKVSASRIKTKDILGAALTIIMIAILATVGYLLFQRAFRPQPIAKFLPQSTIASFEINSNFSHNQFTKGFEHLKEFPAYSQDNFKKTIEDKFLVNFESEIAPWLGRQVGVAYLAAVDNPDEINSIYFGEIYSRKNAEIFVNKITEPTDYKEMKLYTLPEDRGAVIIKNQYLFFSRNKSALEQLIDFYASGEESLDKSPKYRKIYNNLPVSNLATLYLNFNEFSDSFFSFVPFLKENALTDDLIKPFLTLFDSEGFALIALDDKFAVQSFLNLKTDKLKNKSFITFKEKYRASLAQYVLHDSIAFWGGKNLEYQFKRIIQALSGGEEDLMDATDSVLQNYTQKYFGSGVSLGQDILPLLSNEFAFAIEEFEGKKVYKLIIETDDSQQTLDQLNKMSDNFAKVGAIFEQKVVDHTLPDGTASREIIAVPKEVSKIEHEYNNTKIYELHVSDQKQFYYAVSKNIGVISNHIEGIKSLIDLQNGDKASLSSSEAFNQLIAPILLSSDEVSYFNLEKLIEEKTSLFLPFTSMSSGKNYFNDGVSTINYLDIK